MYSNDIIYCGYGRFLTFDSLAECGFGVAKEDCWAGRKRVATGGVVFGLILCAQV